MRFFPFKILILCILLPPVVYIFSVQKIEQRLNVAYTDGIKDIYTGNPRLLLEGSISLKDALDRNITRYLGSRKLAPWGVTPSVAVTTKQGTILYPPVFEESVQSMTSPDPMKVAAGNYKLMNEGLVIHVNVKLEHNTPLTSLILMMTIGGSLCVLFVFYRAGVRKALWADQEKSREIERLLEQEEDYEEQVETVRQKREELETRFETLKEDLDKEKQKAVRNEDGMIEEIVHLEREIDKNITLQQEQKKEIDQLSVQIVDFTKSNQRDMRQLFKASSAVRKRFETLYKNVIVHKKAISGFCSLSEDMKIKGEEVIHQINENSEKVQIKRKVFSKRGRETVLEVIFAYKGRLYFRQSKLKGVEILSIGTKNSQMKDLEFLDKLPSD